MPLEKCLCWGVPQDKSVPTESIFLSQHPSRSNTRFSHSKQENNKDTILGSLYFCR